VGTRHDISSSLHLLDAPDPVIALDEVEHECHGLAVDFPNDGITRDVVAERSGGELADTIHERGQGQDRSS